MGVITQTSVKVADASAGKKKAILLKLTPGSASDTLDLSAYFSAIHSVSGAILTEAPDANSNIVNYCTVSGTTITFVGKKADGTTNASVFKAFYVTVWGE